MPTAPPARPARSAADLDAVRAALADEYDILDELGRGGMAIVYRARERALDREVAVKVLPAAFTFDEEFVERFLREARTSAQLEHPHIVPIYRVGRAGSVVYFVMKLLRGQSLAARLEGAGRLPAAELRRVLVETASALGYAHRRGVVHRDVKPDNVMLDEDGRCVVTDFGIAKSGAEQRLTATGMSVGTPRYMSPEQARAQEVDGRSDLYSLGIVGYECLAGTTPFEGGDPIAVLMAHVSAPVPRPPLRTPEDEQLYAVIERLLAKRPEDRFASSEAVVTALGGDAAHTGQGPRFMPRGAQSATPTRVSAAVRPAAGAAVSGESAEPSGPAPALDAALNAGLALLKEQQPRVAAAAGVAAAGAARRAAGVRGYAAGRSRRFWMGTAAAAVASVGVYYAAHFGIYHRSRCPQVAATPPAADSSARPAPAAGIAKARPRLSLLVDAPGSRPAGGSVQLYYDVCGLDAGAGFTTRVVVRAHQSGFKKLFGPPRPPRTAQFTERAGGPATRRHETIDLDGLEPGWYALDVAVTDSAGRRRAEARDFQIK